jgi:hypothetical protein
LRRGRQRQPGGAWSRLAQGDDKGSIRRLSLFDRDELTDHRGDQGFEDGLGTRQPQSTMPAVQVGDEALRGTKIAVVVLLTAQGRSVRDGPASAWTPRLDLDRGAFLVNTRGGGAFRRTRGSPDIVAIPP